MSPQRPKGKRPRGSRERTTPAPASVAGPESLRVRDLMVHALVTVDHEAGLATAANLMRTRRLRHLPVLDGARRLVGILTDRDLRRTLLDPALHQAPGHLPGVIERIKVREVMTLGALTVNVEMEVREAARLMHERDIGALPVVALQGRIVGMLTATDIMQSFVSGRVRKRTLKARRPPSR